MPFLKWKKEFWNYVNRSDFYYNREQIDPYQYHSLFAKFAILFGVMDNAKKNVWAYLTRIAVTVSGIGNGIIFLISAINHVKFLNLSNLTENVTFLIFMIYEVIIICCIMGGENNFHNLLQGMKNDFCYVYTRGQKYRERFFKNQLITFKASVFLLIITLWTAMSMIICFAASWIIALYKQQDGDKRPLMFQVSLFDYDLHATPIYEIMFFVSISLIAIYTYLYAFIMVTYVVWIRQITCKADIIIWNLEDLLVDVVPAKNQEQKYYYSSLIKHRMREIIIMHYDMYKLLDEFAAAFKLCILFEQVTSSPVICMTAFCTFMEGEGGAFLFILCIGCILVTFVPNFLCTHLLEKVESIGDACWDVPFWNAEPMLRMYLVIMMQRSKRQLPLSAPGFARISLETYANTLSRAYSCFQMLRQVDITG